MSKKQILLKFFSGIQNILSNAGAQSELRGIKKLPNVFIDDSFTLGSTGFIKIEGKVKKLRIENKVTCRNYCNFYLNEGADLTIHKNVFFNNYCSVNCLESIEIGENTMFGEGVKIYDHNHKYSTNPVKVERGSFTTAPVTIGKNCWIGSNVIILKGVSIGDNVIIGANCLIYKSIPANSIVKHKEALEIKNL